MPVCDQLAVFASQSFKKQLQAPADCTLYNGLSKKNRHGCAAVKPRNNKRLSHFFHEVFCSNTEGYNLVRCVLAFIYLYVIIVILLYIYLNHCSPIHVCLLLELFQAHHALPLIEGYSRPMTLLGFSKPIWHWAFPSPCGIRLFQAHLPGAASLFQDQGPSSLFQDY